MKRALMSIERKKNILSRIQELGSVSVNELSSLFGVSEETIRRDLKELESEHRISRVYGGAYLGNTVSQDVPYNLRRDTLKKEKDLIAQAAFQFINSGDTVFLDPSTTSLAIAQLMKKKKNTTVITNALYIANALADSESARIICTGGEMDKQRQTFTGCATLEMLESYYADIAFVSCTGVNFTSGLTDSSETQARIRNMMLKHAQKKILIADYTKFGKTTLSQIAPLSDINCVICDSKLSEDWRKYFEEQHIQFIDASEL